MYWRSFGKFSVSVCFAYVLLVNTLSNEDNYGMAGVSVDVHCVPCCAVVLWNVIRQWDITTVCAEYIVQTLPWYPLQICQSLSEPGRMNLNGSEFFTMRLGIEDWT